MAIIVHLNGENWKTHAQEHVEFNDADMRDRHVKQAFQGFIVKGLTNVNCVMEDTQSPEGTSTRFTHPYTYNHNGDIERFTYDDQYRQADMA
jgi:hypothetical protein